MIMYFLSKFLPLFVLPLGFVFVVSITGYLLYRYKFRWGKWLIVAAGIWLYLCSNSMVANFLARQWETSPADYHHLKNEPVETVVVLGAVLEYWSGETRPREYQIIDPTDRLMEGLYLVRNGFANRMIFSGGKNPLNDDPAETLLLQQFLDDFPLVADSLVLMESKAQNTEDNARFVSQLLDEEQLSRRIALVTSARHMPRARYIFEYEGCEVIPVPTDYIGQKKTFDNLFINLIPNTSALHYSSQIMREWLGYVYYQIKY